MEIKPRTLLDYRACIRLYVTPRIGHLPIQALRPSLITKLYRDLLTSGGRDGQPLAVATATHLHAVLRKAFREPIYPDTVTSLMTKIIRAHNEPDQGPCPNDQLPHARLHDLRHLHATTLLLSGVPVHVVAARLGHADPAITLRVYAHVIRSAEAAAADIFAQAVKAA